MKFTRLYKAAFISAGITAVALYTALPPMMSGAACSALVDTTAVENCLNTSQQNWYSWFQGKSRSTQFHYVDLLELLTRLSPAQKP